MLPFQHQLIMAESAKLQHEAKKLLEELLGAAANFYASLEMFQQYDRLLTRRGHRRGFRPDCVKLHPREENWLAPDCHESVRRYIENRAAAVGVENPLKR